MRRRVGMFLIGLMLCAGRAWAQEPPPAQPPPPDPVAAQAPAPAQTTAVPGAEGYVWAGECKACHEDVHDSWSKTKHARTLDRLSSDERKADSQCVGCHVTGPKTPIEGEGRILNTGVQCESCHGPGKAHVEAAKAGNAAAARMVKSPPQRLCETCHNDKSPHYRGFFFAALKGLVHKK